MPDFNFNTFDFMITEENEPKAFFENPQSPRLKEFLSKVL